MMEEEKPLLLEESSEANQHDDRLPEVKKGAARSGSLPPAHIHQTYSIFIKQLLAWIRSMIWHTFLFLLPSFISSRLSRNSKATHAARVHGTAYLDGIRGTAAIVVYIFHFSYCYFDVNAGYGVRDLYSPLQLPIIRIFYNGSAPVSIFFIVSGFALSIRPIKQMHAQQFDGILRSTSSALLRRPLRLFGPCIVSTFLIFLLLRLGAYDATRFFHNAHPKTATWDDGGHLSFEPVLRDDIYIWLTELYRLILVEPWTGKKWRAHYDVHLWTIPVEFSGSLALFAMHVCVCRLKTVWRLFIVLGLIVLFGVLGRWELILFFTGAVLAEVNLLMQKYKPANLITLPLATSTGMSLSSPASIWIRRLKATFWTFLVLLSLYLLTSPGKAASYTPGYKTLSRLMPKGTSEVMVDRFWELPGAALFIFCASTVSLLTRTFSNSFFHYLGKISFAVYLIHSMVNHLVGFALVWSAWQVTGRTSMIGVCTGFVIGFSLNTVVVVWAADVFWRAVDMPLVRLGKWIEERITV